MSVVDRQSVPRISVVVPSYNQGQFIAETLDSILMQSGGDGVSALEVVVRDGGSTDETLSILQDYGDRITWVSEPDGGQAAAVNLGWAQTAGDVLGWLNSDDLYLPGAFEAVLEAFDDHPDVDVVYGDGVYVDASGRRIGRYGTRRFDASRLLDECYICQPTVFLRRSVFERFGGLRTDLRYCMDYEYWIRLSRKLRFLKIDRELAVTRWYSDTKTLVNRYAVHHETCAMLREAVGFVPTAWVGAWTSVWMDDLAFLRPLRALGAIWLCLLLGCSLGNALRMSGMKGFSHGAPFVWERIKRLVRRIGRGRDTGLDDRVFERV